MREVNYEQICTMTGNGVSMRFVLKYFIGKGAKVYILHESLGKNISRFFMVEYEGLKIPLRAYKRCFYCVYNAALSLPLTSDKSKSYALLSEWGIPTPYTAQFNDSFDEQAFFATYGKGVVKPAAISTHGEGITLGIKDKASLAGAVAVAQNTNSEVLVQQQIDGDDYRLLFIDYQFVAAVKRLPATIKGDGTHSIREIVEQSNAKLATMWAQKLHGDLEIDEQKGSTSPTPLEEIVQARGEEFLAKVPAKDESVRLLDKANVSLGGQTYDVTDTVNSQLTEQISRMLKAIGLPFCGIDVLSTDIGSSPESKQSFVIELNAAPGLRLHEMPYEGQPRHVCAQVAESLIAYYKNLS